MLMIANREGGGVGVLEGRKLLDGEVLSVRGDCICLTLFISCLCFSSWWLVSESFPSRPPEEETEATKDCFILLPWYLLFLPVFFIRPFFRRREMSQSEGSAQSCNSCIKDYFFVPFLVLHLFKSAKLCAASVPHWLDNQKSVWDVNEQLFYCSTYRWLFMICVYSRPEAHRGYGVSQACWEHDGGLICQQVVSLNDGRADSPVECSSEWVGCGMTVWGHPTFSRGAPSVNETRPHGKLWAFFPPLAICSRRRPRIGWNSQPAQALTWLPPPGTHPPPYFLDCLEIMTVWYGHNRQIWT